MRIPEKPATFNSPNAAEPEPPAYNDLQPSRTGDGKQQPPPEYSHSESSIAQPSNHVSQHLRSSRFPTQFNVYMHFSTFSLGPHEDNKLFTVVQTGLRKPMKLIQGSEKKASPLSTLKMKGMGSTSNLTIFPHDGGELIYPLEITIENHSTRHCFCIGLPNKAPQYFEWRSSKSEEVQALGAYKRGWKLVWLRKDGRKDEIVAASALNNTMSMKKGLKFGFFNAGLDGTLGDTFQIAAVTTAMSDFEVFMSTNVAIAGSASAAASSASVAAAATST
ncbi:uncharacterized protein N0V89_002764 [Didymosphaeria variabile]|uniref:Uncharacterized protein n=1 Tax=Didymosphaeria variabile TaxID=1932322 RepID=A0A9W8XUX3_9PLEO|nr:uncharacterized protein N0V89_002764 [Didymosphaeria variabile]KAJ4358185.1 hypothetical protein N0V89_002764 [Didymosphaeria variabile]